jgi:transposase
MAAENEKLRARIDEIENEKALCEQQLLNFEESIKALRKEIFSASSERRPEATDRARDKSQTDALLFSQSAFPSKETREEAKSKLRKNEIEHDITIDELTEESELRGIENASADQWQELKNVFDQVTILQVHERTYSLEVHKKKKYKLKSEFNKSDKDVIITAKGPDQLLLGMNYSTDFVASVVADKYISHLPLERQTREMESLGLKNIKTSTLSRQCALAAGSLEPIQIKILAELKSSDVALHLDETTWKIQNKNQKDGYMWVISNRLGSYYFFKPTRSGQVIKEKLEGYSGAVLTDAYGGYNALDETNIKQGFCWAHARRQFLPLEDHDPTVKPILDDIDKIFAVERRARTFEELKLLRDKESRPLVQELRDKLWLEYPNSRDGSQKRTAIEYLTKRWDGFTLFLNDIRLPLSNNEAERTIRHAVVGRKNYYGANTHSGADTAATLFTVIESCKKNDIDPRSFLYMALQAAARGENLVTPLEYAQKLRQ